MALAETCEWLRKKMISGDGASRFRTRACIACFPSLRSQRFPSSGPARRAKKKYNGEVRYSGGVSYITRPNFFDDAADGRLWRWLGEAEQLSEGGEWFACSGKRGADYFQMRQTFSADGRLHRSKECRLFPKRADFFFLSEILFPPRSDEADHFIPFRTI